MRNIIIKPVLALALATASISPAFADPLYASNQSLQDLRSHNDMAAKAYFTFTMGGKKVTLKDRFRSGLKLQMRNVLQSQSPQFNSFSYSSSDINLFDLSMGAKGFSSMQLNGVPLQRAGYSLGATEESGKSRINNGLLIAGGVILAIGVGAFAAGGDDNDNGVDQNDNDGDGNQ